MPAVPDPQVLGEMPLFKGLTLNELAPLNELLRRTSFPSGANLITVDQPGEVSYIIFSGTVKVHVEQEDGGDVILAILGPGELLGEMSLIESASRSATIVTLEESTMFWIDHATLRSWAQSNPVITWNLIRILSRRLRLANAQIQSLATQDVFGRVARQLLAFAEEYGREAVRGTEIPLRLTQTDLASLVGASRVRVNQVLVHYQQRSYISVASNHHVTILDSAALAQRCR